MYEVEGEMVKGRMNGKGKMEEEVAVMKMGM